MKVYFTASIVGKKYYLDNYLKILQILKQKNLSVIYEHIINSSEEQIKLQTKQKRENFHKQLKKWIIECSCMVTEASFPSISVGFEISLALNLGKPVLLLYTKEAPTLFSSYTDEKLICEKYSLTNLKGIIDDFINYAEGKTEHRFTFFITSEMADFLETVAIKHKIPKSVYLRQLIEKAKQKS